jgi:DNA polymerase delta subunit 1
MIDLGIKDTTLCNEWGHKLSEEISKLFPPPIKMEFEKAMRMLCIRKKKYAAFLVDKHGKLNTDPKKMLVRGIILARRDSSKWLQDVYSKLLYNVMTRNDMFSSLKIIYSAISDLVNLKLDIKFLITVKQLGSNYKSENNYLKVFSDRLAKLNQKVNPGDRIEYLIIKSDSKLLGERMVTPEMYFDGNYTLDILYYLDHLLKNPIDQLFSIGHMHDLKDYSEFGFRTKRKLIPISNPILLSFTAIKEGSTLQDIENFIFN